MELELFKKRRRMEMEMEMEMELPIEIASNILSRLPFDSVIQFKCLSKYWYNLFQRLIHTSGELYFAQNHRSRLMKNYTYVRYSYTSQSIYDNGSDDSFSDSSSESDIHEYPCSSFSPSSLPDSVLLMLDHQSTTTLDTNHEHLLLHYAEYYEDQKGWFNCKAVKELNCPLPLDMININSNFWTMSTSSNGLVCSLVRNTITNSYLFCIYNPFLGEYVTLPDDDEPHMISSCTMAFGFSHIPSTDEYKVVRIVYPNTPGGGCGDIGNIEIYTLGGGGGGKWTSKGIIKRRLQCDTPGVLVNGSLHWLTEEDERYKKIKQQQQKAYLITDEQDDEFMQRIMVFNLLEEEFDHMIRPPVFHSNFRIKEWGGYLCGINYRDELRIHYTWKFYMYGRLSKNEVLVDGEWKKIFSTQWRGGGGGLIEPYEDLFFYNKANQALLWTTCISKKKTKSYKFNSLVVAVKMDIFARFFEKDLNAAKLFHGIFHIKSFVSLKALGENNTKIIIDDDMKRKQDNNTKDEIMNACTTEEETIV